MSTKPVSLVIPVYNQLDYTRQCLESIVRCTDQSYELIIVDNASTDGTLEFLKDVKATIITNQYNLGCAKAWNQGVRASHGDVIGILNNDIVVTPGWLKDLLSYMQRSGHGIACPSAREGMLNYDLDSYALNLLVAVYGDTFGALWPMYVDSEGGLRPDRAI